MEWMTIRGLSKATNFPEHAIRLLVKDGTIPSIMVGNRNMIHYETAIEIMTSQKAPKEEKSDGDTRKMDVKEVIEMLEEIDDKLVSEFNELRNTRHYMSMSSTSSKNYMVGVPPEDATGW